MTRTRRAGLRPLAGLALAGYGLLVVTGVLPHDATLAGVASLALGLLLLLPGLPSLPVRRGRWVALLGAVAVTGVVGWNALRHSGLSLPEWGIVLYGAALLLAAPFLGRRVARTDVATLVGWSFPLLLVPLALFSLNAVLGDPERPSTAGAPLVHALIVVPSAWALRLVGTAVTVTGNTLLLAHGTRGLALGVGLVCAGLYPMALFGGLLAMHLWRDRLPWRRGLALLAGGLAGLWLTNILRVVLLAKVGQRWGAQALQETHANLGWILFVAFMALFWAVALRRGKPAVGAT